MFSGGGDLPSRRTNWSEIARSIRSTNENEQRTDVKSATPRALPILVNLRMAMFYHAVWGKASAKIRQSSSYVFW